LRLSIRQRPQYVVSYRFRSSGESAFLFALTVPNITIPLLGCFYEFRAAALAGDSDTAFAFGHPAALAAGGAGKNSVSLVLPQPFRRIPEKAKHAAFQFEIKFRFPGSRPGIP
jgi:hypothetical protein